MRGIITSVMLLLAVLGSLAQRRDLLVSYVYTHPEQTMRSAEADIENQYRLLTNGLRSKFFSPKTEYVDSIESTPEGFESFNTFKRVCHEKKQQHLIPRVDGSFYVTKSFGNNSIVTYDVASGTRFKWTEQMKDLKWEIQDSVKNVLEYECFMAQSEFHGRIWTVWFAPEIPISDGPWKLSGLPGLILEAECENAQYRFCATGVQMTENPIYEVYSEPNWEPITGNDFWNLRRECLKNPSRNIKSGSNIIVYKGLNYETYLPKEIVDYIETDYK